MAKKQKKTEDIPKPKEDIKREGSFKNDFASFIKKTSTKPKEKPSD